MNSDGAGELGRALAERHGDSVEPVPQFSVVNYAESPRDGDWSMRSSLMRFAQPEAARAGSVLQLVRRLDAVLHQVHRLLERHTVGCDRGLDLGQLGADPVDPYPDTRTADLARAERLDPASFPSLLAGYETAYELEPEERAALPLLGVALELDDLAATLTSWANRGPEDPPVEAVDRATALVATRLDELGVPVEDGPPNRRRG